MNVIDSYRFGLIVVNGKNYTSDVIILLDKVKDNWYRKTGHQLHLDDLSEVIAENPEVLIVGTGASSSLPSLLARRVRYITIFAIPRGSLLPSMLRANVNDEGAPQGTPSLVAWTKTDNYGAKVISTSST